MVKVLLEPCSTRPCFETAYDLVAGHWPLSEKKTMQQNSFPPGWSEERVRRVLAHYEGQTEAEAVAEDEATLVEDSTETNKEIPPR
jgi:hypothetical protein